MSAPTHDIVQKLWNLCHILRDDAPAVFRMYDSMCEPATHRNWARNLCKSASCFGLQQGADANSLAA